MITNLIINVKRPDGLRVAEGTVIVGCVGRWHCPIQ